MREDEEMTAQAPAQPAAPAYAASEQLRQTLLEQDLARGTTNGFDALGQAIGREQILNATQILMRYKQGKANLENRIVENERWYKMRHWECLRKKQTNMVEPSSGWLFNCLANKHADAMDNYPSPNILPREEMDKFTAKTLSSVIPVVLDQADFEQTYSDAWQYKLKTGTGVYGIFWDGEKLNGLGDISIKQCDLLNLFWEPGIKDIQKSRHFFSVELMDNELLEQQYPQLKDKLGSSTLTVSQYVYDDTVDTTTKSAVIDWYYKKKNGSKDVLHYCKYVNDVVLFATENEPQNYPNGLYDHAMYPYVFDTLFTEEGTPCGFGYVDVGKSAQEYIDRLNQAIIQNALANARPRHFIRKDGAVNEEEFADITKDFIHVDGNLGQDSIIPVQTNPLGNIYMEVMNQKIDELKEVTGNRDINTGGSSSGVTAASAIAAMQEAGSKLSRDHIKASYRAFRSVVLMIIELIRQFYDAPRFFRVLGQGGEETFIMFSNIDIQMQNMEAQMGMEATHRMPLFDVEITAQKSSPYSKMAQNELALQFYSAGFFNPAMADQALACLDMMDFDRKDSIMQKIGQNGMMYQMAMAQAMSAPMAPMGGAAQMPRSDETGSAGESAVTKNARQRVADSTSPT